MALPRNENANEISKALESYKQDVESGLEDAMVSLANAYKKNNDIHAACYWSLMAAKSGNASIARSGTNLLITISKESLHADHQSIVYTALGICYENGYGLQKNIRLASHCYENALDVREEYQYPPANFCLGINFELAHGVARHHKSDIRNQPYVQDLSGAECEYKKVINHPTASAELKKAASRRLRTIEHHRKLSLFTSLPRVDAKAVEQYTVPKMQWKPKLD